MRANANPELVKIFTSEQAAECEFFKSTWNNPLNQSFDALNESGLPAGVPKSKSSSGAETRQRLLEVAEELFSEQGFDRVSVRDITVRAGANVAAVNYHFGGREGLIEQVMERYINPVNAERVARLDELERRAGRRPLALEEILDAFVRPVATQVRRSELSVKLFMKLVARISASQAARMPESVERNLGEMLSRFIRAFARALPELDREELLWRIHFTVGAMIHMMAHGGSLHRISGGASGQPTMEQTLSRFIRYTAAGMREGSELEEPAGPAGPQSEFSFE